jgi:ribosomal protein L37AE/L43A
MSRCTHQHPACPGCGRRLAHSFTPGSSWVCLRCNRTFTKEAISNALKDTPGYAMLRDLMGWA